MKNSLNNTDPFDPHDGQWYISLYEEMFLSLIYCSYKIIHDEAQAEVIAEQCFWKLKELVTEGGKEIASLNHVKSYLRKMVTNASLDYRRSGQGSFVICVDEEVLDAMDTEILTHEQEEYEALYDQILELVEQLPPKSREIMKLFFIENKETAEVAQIVGQSVNNIYQAKKRALTMMREMVKNRDKYMPPNTLILLCWLYILNK